MKEMKKILSFFLVLVMVLGMVPAMGIAMPVEAAGETIYVLAGGDFQAGDNGQEDHYYSRINMGNILDKIKETHGTMDGFIFVGDYDGDTHNDSNAATGVAAVMEEVSERYSNLNHDNSYLIEGNHETGAVSGIDATGGYDCDGYAVYLINESDFCERQEGKSSQIQTVANNLKAWLNNKIGEGYDAPIFVATHTPLGYTTRTYTNGDSLYGKYVFDVLNDAAANGLNIIFLHGHDHAYGADNYLGGEAIYLPVGDKINICVPGDKTAWTEETLNFTYMNAGYVGYYNENYYDVTSYEEDKLTMTVFAITGNQVTVERYSKNGLYNLKSEGREGFYSNASTCANIGLSYNTTIYSSPQTIVLGEAEDYGDIGSWVGVEEEVTNDVTTSGGGWITITTPVAGTTTYAYTQATSITAGEEYVIVGSDDAAAFMNNNGSINTQTVTIPNNGATMTSTVELTEWTFSGSSNGTISNGTVYLRRNSNSLQFGNSSSNNREWTISNEGNGEYVISNSSRYLYYTGSTFGLVRNTEQSVRLFVRNEAGDTTTGGTNGEFAKLSGNLSYTVAQGTSASDALATVKAGIDGYTYTGMAAPTSGGTVLNDGELTWELDSSYNGNVPGDYAVTIYYKGEVLGTAEVVVPATTTYYIAEGNGLYLVDMNTTADNAMAAVKAGVTVYSATDASGTGKTPVDDSLVTWNWVDTYKGNDSGPYTVEILYNGTSLGTVEVKVNVQYETGINADWTYIGESEATGGVYYQRVEDVDDLVSGERYLIILDCSNQTAADAFVIPTIVTTGSGSSQRRGPDVVASNGITDNATITGDYDDYLWTLTESGNGWKIGNGSQYINVTLNNTSNRGELSFTNSGEALTIASGSNNPSDADSYSFAIRDSSSLYWQYNLSATLVYATEGDDYTSRFVFYGREESDVTPGGPIYAKITGNTIYTVEQGTSRAAAMEEVKAGITGWLSGNADGSDPTQMDDKELTWTWKNTYNSTVTGSYWVEISYNGKVLGTVEVIVEPGVINNYPEYPDEGAVKVGKTSTGIDFQASGIAQVELSASGVPSKKGVDVIVMLDTSSSMNTYTVTGSDKTRLTVLEESMEDLVAAFQTPGDDGELLDIRVAIADFNGFDGYGGATGTPYGREETDRMSDNISYTANGNQAQIYTGTENLTAGAFISAADLETDWVGTLTYASGTNYDYAFDAIYQLGTAIKETWSSEDERDLYVIFMSDGAAMQWNYFHSQGESHLWNEWITGMYTDDNENTVKYSTIEEVENRLLIEGTVDNSAHSYYFNLQDTDGDGVLNEHRMANAVKGDPTKNYEVIRKSTAGLPDGTMIAVDGYENLYTVPGLGATVFSISFDAQADTNVTEESMDLSIETLASEQTGTTKYYYKVTSADELSAAFNVIGTEIAYAANNARYVDQVGDSFNLQLETSTYSVVKRDANGNTVDENGDGQPDMETKTLAPVIEILTYDIYTKVEADAVAEGTAGDTVTNAMIGQRKGTYILNEVVKFSDDGTKAYSNLIDVDKDGNYGVTVNSNGTYSINDTDDNIIGTDGIIYAKSFLYNTGVLGVAVEGVSIPVAVKTDGTTTGSTNVLPSETFYWKMDTITTTELAMRYYVYLEGSMEGTTNAGSYSTNEFAILYYDNYLGNPCRKETVSPTVAWKSANVSYAFYLVNDQGEIIVNQTTGLTGNFANKVAVTRPVVYEEILLNNTDQIKSINVKAISDDVLPKYYELYDEGAVYTITINSNSTGEWEIINGGKPVNSTYVTQYKSDDASAYSNALTNSTVGDDYTHTIVWFAVVWSVQAHPDTVVIDYGLPVDISVMANDMFGQNGTLAGIGAYTEGLEDIKAGSALETGFGQTYTGKFGNARADLETGLVRYTPTTMELNGYDKFAYAVQYSGTENAGYYYDTVTVIPATSVYFEDDFLSYTIVDNMGTSDGSDDTVTKNDWETAGTRVEGVQDEDRPGQYSLTDANNIYGYDGVNLGMSTFSLGSAKKVTVNANTYATAQFTFYGSGFDIVSMASKDTGTLIVQVFDENNALVLSKVVDTYYGYTYGLYNVTYTYQNGEWVRTVGEVAADATEESLVDTSAAGTEGESKTAIEYCWVLLAPGESNPNGTDVVYQVPVIQVEDLTYGKYTAKLTVSYFDVFNHQEDGAYDFYLDAVRIYDPTNDGEVDNVDENGNETGDTTIEGAYAADGESWPYYLELRNLLLDKGSLNVNDEILNDSKVEGIVFIDGDAEVKDAQLEDYANVGPNNEVYLKPGQRIAFILNLDAFGTDNIKSVHIGLRSSGEKSTYTVFNVAQNADTENNIAAGQYYNVRTYQIESGTDMYYDLTDWKNDIIVISNTGAMYGTSTNLYITNIKITFKEKPVTSIELTVPTKTTYTVGEELDLTGMELVAKLDNEVVETLAVLDTGYAVSEVDMSTAGTKSVTVTYRGHSVTFDITVNEAEAATASVELPQLRTSATAETSAVTEASDGTEPVVITSEAQPVVYMTGYAASVALEGINAQASEATTPEETVPEEPVPEEPEVPAEPEVPEEPEDPATFDPKKMEVIIIRDTVKQGSSIVVTILTSADVDSLTINGETVTRCAYSRRTGIKTWIVTLQAEVVGEMEISVVANNDQGEHSEAIVEYITVEERRNSFWDDLRNWIFG